MTMSKRQIKKETDKLAKKQSDPCVQACY